MKKAALNRSISILQRRVLIGLLKLAGMAQEFKSGRMGLFTKDIGGMISSIPKGDSSIAKGTFLKGSGIMECSMEKLLSLEQTVAHTLGNLKMIYNMVRVSIFSLIRLLMRGSSKKGSFMGKGI